MARPTKRKSTGTKRTASGAASSSSRREARRRYPFYVVCTDNSGNEASLDIGRVYKVIAPRHADRPYHLRVIDNEGEDYLYDQSQFVPVDLPLKAKRAVARAAVLAT